MNPETIREMQEAIRGEGLDGWLFYNFRHRDGLADGILGIDPGAANSRPWFYAVPASAAPLAVLHVIERDVLGSLEAAPPGSRVFYQSREELIRCLGALAGKRWGCHISRTIPAVSFLDAGTAALLEEAGLRLVSAEGLLQRFRGLLDAAGMAAHEQAAAHLYEIAAISWAAVRRAFRSGAALYEGDIRRLMLEEFDKRNLTADHPPIVAAGANSGNPHYDLAGPGARIAAGDVIQFDLWARDAAAGGIYADISWAGVYAQAAAEKIQAPFAALVRAREGAYRFIGDELAAGRRPSGASVDRKAREILAGAGYGGAIRHRTGHGIDADVHGAGVNMDSVEFPDSRPLLDGSCFSLEPGIYFDDFGMRTEINVYIRDGSPVISGTGRQFELLYC
jgi:Xaa-Pro aminopeptidase